MPFWSRKDKDPVCGMEVEKKKAAAMALSFLSVVTNANMLRRFKTKAA